MVDDFCMYALSIAVEDVGQSGSRIDDDSRVVSKDDSNVGNATTFKAVFARTVPPAL